MYQLHNTRGIATATPPLVANINIKRTGKKLQKKNNCGQLQERSTRQAHPSECAGLCWDNNVIFLPFPYRIYSLYPHCGVWILVCKIKMMSNVVWFFVWKFITRRRCAMIHYRSLVTKRITITKKTRVGGGWSRQVKTKDKSRKLLTHQKNGKKLQNNGARA